MQKKKCKHYRENLKGDICKMEVLFTKIKKIMQKLINHSNTWKGQMVRVHMQKSPISGI